MVRAIGYLLLIAGYGALAVVLAPWLPTTGLVAFGAALMFSLITFTWVEGVFQSDDNAEPRTSSQAFQDLRYSLPASLALPVPLLVGALAAIWLLESRTELGLLALLIAAALAVLSLRSSLRIRS